MYMQLNNEARAYIAMRARALLFRRLTDTNVYGNLATRYPWIWIVLQCSLLRVQATLRQRKYPSATN